MEQIRNRRNLNRFTVVLAIILLVCTFLSRTIENSLLPAVTTAYPSGGTLDLSLRTSAEAELDPDSGEKQVVLLLTQSEAERLSPGGRVSLSWVDRAMHPSVAVSEISEITRDPDTGLIRVTIPADSMELREGQEAEVKLVRTSEYHGVLLPAFAVRTGRDGEEYVFLLRQKEGLFGTEYYAEQFPVTIRERNDLYAAVDGIFNMADQVVLTATRPLSSGQKVRVTDR